jgi:hypothetical protein
VSHHHVSGVCRKCVSGAVAEYSLLCCAAALGKRVRPLMPFLHIMCMAYVLATHCVYQLQSSIRLTAHCIHLLHKAAWLAAYCIFL